MNELSGTSQVYVGNIDNVWLARIVAELPTNCGCFTHSPKWDGHNLNPPCRIVELGMTVHRLAIEAGQEMRAQHEKEGTA